MAVPTTAPASEGEIKFKAETAGSPAAAIATPSTYWAASPKKLPAWDIAPKFDYASVEDTSVQPHWGAHPAKLLVAKTPMLAFKTWLTALAQTWADATPVTQDDLGLLLKCALGGEYLGTSTTAAAASGAGATAPLKVASAAGLTAGGAVCVNGEARRIVSIAGTDVTLDMDLSAAPTLADPVLVAATYYPDESALTDLADAAHITVAALFRGYHTEDQHQFRGCWPQIQLAEIGPGKLPVLDVTLHALDAELVTGVAIDTAPTQVAPPAQVNGGFYWNTGGVTALNLVHVRDFVIALGLTPTPLPSPTGANGVAGHIVLPQPTTFDAEFYYDADYNAAYEARTAKVCGYQIGRPNTSRGAILFSFPSATIDASPERTGADATGAKATLHANNGSVTTSDMTRAKFAIHRFPKTAS